MADKPTDFYRMRAKVLEKQLEHEQEWETYFPGITNREYATYADACACGMARRLMMVDAPDTTSPPAAFAAAARASARKSAPPWLKKRLSSAASVALRSMSGTSRSRTGSVW